MRFAVVSLLKIRIDVLWFGHRDIARQVGSDGWEEYTASIFGEEPEAVCFFKMLVSTCYIYITGYHNSEDHKINLLFYYV